MFYITHTLNYFLCLKIFFFLPLFSLLIIQSQCNYSLALFVFYTVPSVLHKFLYIPFANVCKLFDNFVILLYTNKKTRRSYYGKYCYGLCTH